MKKLPLIFSFLVLVGLVAQQAYAQGAEGAAAAGLNTVAIKYIAYFFALGIAVFGGTQAQSKAASVALEGIARNPAAADKIQTPMILGLALMESLVIFALISTFLV
ncbi:F0F1 ATP synthase subunit C [Bacteriovorax stolpii]|uniref:ATP synthase F0 subunit C n=1 Tax=Bacteriovorax stolpii TaxID=960 RepID=UPI00115BCF5E|nr:ATP synthase F0 subunit C [Bacteriovorax stolpii]QDK43543.1 F0F1 ATP synthase subunit C [Bacteriovorax stolpii]BDT26546.1 ATP synthase F0 subunit C [Bacteriovorax sp. HI3]